MGEGSSLMDAQFKVTLILMGLGVISGTIVLIVGVVSRFRNKKREYIRCDSIVLCPRLIRNNWWGRLWASGWWFSPKDDIAFCPTHVPENIFVWRKREDYRVG